MEVLRELLRLFLRIFLKLLTVFRLIYCLTFIYAYLSQRKQKTKIGSTFRKRMSMLFGAPWESILEQRLFIICIWDLFISSDRLELRSYAIDTTSFVHEENFDQILGELEKHFVENSEWLNPMQRNFTFLKSICWQSTKHWKFYHKIKLRGGSFRSYNWQ